jgi:predicted DNA-binding transcriptional regulator AlpA
MQNTEHMSTAPRGKGKNVAADEQRRMRLAEADPWLNKRETAAHRGVSIATLDRMVARGLFPRGEMVSPGRRGWRLSVVKSAKPVA